MQNLHYGHQRLEVTSSRVVIVSCCSFELLLCFYFFSGLISSLTMVFSVPFRHGERIGFSYLVSQKYTGDSAAVRVLRNSVIHHFNIQLASHRRLIPAHNKGRPPSYYIIAGFVFTAVSVPYLRSEVCSLLSVIYAFLLLVLLCLPEHGL